MAKGKRRRKKHSNNFLELFETFLWLFMSATTTFNIQADPSKNEFVYINFLELVVILIFTYLMLVGLKKKKSMYILPWVLHSIWSMFNHQYCTIEILSITIYRISESSFQSACGLIVVVLCLCFRLYAWTRIIKYTFPEIFKLKSHEKIK